MDIEIYRSLTRAGVPEDEAQRVAESIHEEIDRRLESSDLATKSDLHSLRNELKEDIAGTKAEIREAKTEIGEAKREIAETKKEVADIRKDVAETKKDIAQIRVEMAAEVGKVRVEIASLRSDISDRITALMRWTVSSIFAAAGLTAGVVGAMLKFAH